MWEWQTMTYDDDYSYLTILYINYTIEHIKYNITYNIVVNVLIKLNSYYYIFIMWYPSECVVYILYFSL